MVTLEQNRSVYVRRKRGRVSGGGNLRVPIAKEGEKKAFRNGRILLGKLVRRPPVKASLEGSKATKEKELDGPEKTPTGRKLYYHGTTVNLINKR